MAQFAYVGRDYNGEDAKATLTADSRYEALAVLRDRGITVLSLQQLDEDTSADDAAAKTRRAHVKRFARVSLGDKAIFCRQLAISVGAGVPLREALESVAEDMDNATFKRVLTDVVQNLHDGKTFSEALSLQGRVFPPLFVSLIRTAEESGNMTETLEQLAGSLERTERLVRKVRSITAYPIFVAVFFLIVCFIMTVFVLPQFQHTFEGFNATLPLLTRVIFRINQVLLHNMPFIVIGFALLVAFVVFYSRTGPGRLHMDRIILDLPFFGQCIRKLNVARFCRNLAMMLKGGVPVATAIEIASSTSGNKVLELALLSARGKIVNGQNISTSLGQEGVFPRLVVRMVSVGESSGRLPEVLEKVSDVYEDQVEGSIMVATSLFEPVIICLFGAFVLILVLAIYLPVFTVASTMK